MAAAVLIAWSLVACAAPVNEARRDTLGAVTFVVPAGWQVDRRPLAFSGGNTDGYLSNVGLTTLCPPPDDPDCPLSDDIPHGAAMVRFGSGSLRTTSIFEVLKGPEWTHSVDGMPASEQAQDPAPGPDQLVVNWAITLPTDVHRVQTVTALISGPGADELRSIVRQTVDSIRFEGRPPALPTGPEAEAAFARTVEQLIDSADEGARVNYNSDYYACFPRLAGVAREAVIKSGPTGPLIDPVLATCRVDLEEAPPFSLWRVRLSASWPADAAGRPGQFAEAYYLNAGGEVVGWENLTPQ